MTDVDVAKPLKDFFGVPVYIENDGNVMLLGEQYFGAGKGSGDILALGLGTGMACGISVEGRLLHGRNHVAAEVGHMVIDSEGGEQCVCGKRGCFESCCSATAMKRYARRFASDSPKSLLHEYCGGNIPAIDGGMIDRGFDAGDEVCKKVYDIFTDKLSVGLVNLINIFNPEIIVIGGGVAHAGDRLLVPVREKVRKSLMHPVQECPIVAGRLLSRAGVMGACRLVDLHS
jgi:glucokinase